MCSCASASFAPADFATGESRRCWRLARKCLGASTKNGATPTPGIPARETELVVQSDLAPAGWIEPLLVPDSFEVRMTVPQGFDAYARIFFPFIGADIEVDGEARQEHLTWGQIAQRNGRISHAMMEPETIGQRPDSDAEPDYCLGRASMGDSGPAIATSWVRDRAAVFRRRLSMCFSTVRGERCNRAAISLLEMPSATSRSTSACRSVMPSLDQRLGSGCSSSRRQRSASGWMPCRRNAPAAISSHRRGWPQSSASACSAA